MKNISNDRAPLTIAVTGVGAIIGQGIVRSLRACGVSLRVLGVDRNPNSIGRYLCEDFFAKPSCDESTSEYLNFWCGLLDEKQVDLVLPGLELDVQFFAEHQEVLQASGVVLALNTAPLIELARDKWRLGQVLGSLGLASIPSSLGSDWATCVGELGPPPLLLKPREGNGSRGVVILRDERDFDYWAREKEGLLLQRIIGTDDEEFTVGAFGLGDGESLPPIVFRRRLSSMGNTQYAEVTEQSAIADTVAKLSAYFKPRGPTNYQFRMEGDIPYLLEINPRFSSSTSLRTAFGYNEAEMSIEFYINNKRPGNPNVGTGKAWRYFEDYLVK